MERPDYLNAIRERINVAKNGSVFVAADFADIADNTKIGVCLSRLAEERVLYRIMRGVYVVPFFFLLRPSIYKNNGYDITLVQRLLQHSSAAVTQRYIGLEPQRIEQAIEGHATLI